MKKIVFGITSLRLGGAERVLVDIVNEICDKYDITIFTLYGNGEFESQLSDKVKVISVYQEQFEEMKSFKKKWISLQLVNGGLRKRIYNKYIKNKYDVEVAFLEGPITWILSEKGNSRKIAWVHNDIEDVFGKGTASKMKQSMNKKAYECFDDLVFVSNDNKRKFIEYFEDNKVPKRVIYNYLNCDEVIKKADMDKVKEIDSKEISFVQVSRLVDQKAVSRLIDVHKKLIDDGYKHKIYIVGDGPLREELDSKINDLGVDKSFILLGQRKNPYPYIKRCDYFMLTSYYEGYPMVLLEGKALNKYILITDSAARETLSDYEDKMIVSNNEDGIYEGIRTIVTKKPKVKKGNKGNGDKLLESICNLLEGE